MINCTKATSNVHIYTLICEMKKRQEMSACSMSMDTF